MISEKFVIIGALLILISSFSYLRDTIMGRTRPNRVSWFLWAAAPLVAFSAELKHDVGLPALMTFMVGFGPLLIFLGSFTNRKALWKMSRLDVFCGVLSIFGLILWQITGSGTLAITFSILADMLASVPTIIKSYKEPESETWHVFFFWAISAAITLLAIDSWNFAFYAFPLYILILGMLLAGLIKFKIGTRGRRLVIGEDEQSPAES